MSSTIVASFSELDSYRHCRLKHQLGYIERWRIPIDPEWGVRGRLFHSTLEKHYLAAQARQKLASAKTAEDLVQYEKFIEQCGTEIKHLLYDPEKGTQNEIQEQVEWMYRGYLDLYSVDKGWKILAVEHKLEDWLPTEKGTRSHIRLKGTVDLIVRDLATGGIWIVDHKSCKTLPKGRDTDLDDQFTLYEWLLRKRGNDIRGIIYNAVRWNKLKTRELRTDERFKRTITVRTQKELDRAAVEAYQLLREGWTKGIDQKPVPRSPDGEMCRRKCGYVEACLAGRKGHDMRRMLADQGFVQDFERH